MSGKHPILNKLRIHLKRKDLNWRTGCTACIICRSSSAGVVSHFTTTIQHHIFVSLDSICVSFIPEIQYPSPMYRPLWRSSLRQRQSQFDRCRSAFTNAAKPFRVASKGGMTRTQLLNPCITSHIDRFFISTDETDGNAAAVSVSCKNTVSDKTI